MSVAERTDKESASGEVKPIIRARDWDLSADAFNKLLALLDSDRERAGEQYEALRRTLVTFFDWRGCQAAEELADETLNRAARRLEEGEQIRNLPDYCYGIARFLVLEVTPKQSKIESEPENFQLLEAPSTDLSVRLEREQQFDCLEKCLNELPADDRQLILSYFSNERRTKIDNRINIAGLLGTNLNNLRVRVHRIKTRLEKCVTKCCQ